MNTSSPPDLKEQYKAVVFSMERFIGECEKNVGTLTPEVRESVTQLLKNEVPLLAGRIVHIEKSNTPEEDMIVYMTHVLKIFFKSLSIIDPKSQRVQAFWLTYINIQQSFIDTMAKLPGFSTKTPDEKNIMIRRAVIEAAKLI